MTSSAPLGIILAGGRGTRLAPITPETPKALVPVHDRPAIAHAFAQLAAMSVAEVVVVGGGAWQEHQAAAVRAAAPPSMELELTTQPEPRGPGDALARALHRVGERPCAVLAVDTIVLGDLRSSLAAFVASDAVAGLHLHPTDRPREMGIAEIEGDRVVSLQEKPEHPRSDLAVVGVWLLAARAVRRIAERPAITGAGEADLTGTIAALLAEGETVLGWRIDEPPFSAEWLDTGSLDTLLHAQRRLMAGAPGTTVAPGARVERSTLHAPVLVGNAVIEDCALGPHVVVGDGAVLRGVRLSDALVMPGATLTGVEAAGVVVTGAGIVTSV